VEHLHHFDLAQDPFQNEPDLRFFCESETHRRAQLRVDRALRQSKGLVVLAGEGGTGKSMLARRMFEELEEEMFESSLLIMMQGTADAVSVLRRFCAQLGLEDAPMDRPSLLGALYEQLAIVREDGRHAVLIIDDAHVLGREAMAEIAGLLNLEYEDRRLLSLLLVGMPELDEIIADVPSLAERVDVHVRLEALSEAESTTYLAHRIQAAGGNPQVFEPSAMKAIYTLGGGRPRRMNTLGDNALFEAFLAGRGSVSEDDVRRAGADLSFTPIAAPQPAAARASAPAPETPPIASAPQEMPELFAAATELALDSRPSEPVSDPLGDSIAMAGFETRMPEPPTPEPSFGEPQPQTTVLMNDLSRPDPNSMSSSGIDLASLLGDDGPSDAPRGFPGTGDTMDELQLDVPVNPGDSAGDSFPSFTADNSAGPMAEATRLAVPEQDSFSRRLASTETTETDEIDDLFVELLDD
jgi:type II secretory pathway predicted ATPase ExeA